MLVAVQVRHTAVTVYSCVPIDTPVSVQLVAVERELELGQPLLGAPPSRVTKYSTVPLARWRDGRPRESDRLGARNGA